MSEALTPSARRLGTAVRSFFAWEPPPATKLALAALAHELSARPDGDAVRWVRPEGYHVTLRFLGNVAVADVPALARAVEAALAGSVRFPVTLGATRAFPSVRQPRVVVIELEPEASLAALAARIEAGVVAAGLPAEKRRFHAHLTLGRVRGRRLPALDAPVPDLSALDVHEVVLFRSDLDRDGSRYTPLAQLPLPESL
jgi:RNA 2',3'-cyclic 3'-phosphodiesterase